MKNSLSTKSSLSLFSLLNSSAEFHSGVLSCTRADSAFPCQVSGLRGSLPSFFIAQFIEQTIINAVHDRQYNNKIRQFQQDYVVVVQGQKEADEVESDILSLCQGKVQTIKFPWWGMIPYRPCAKGSVIFGERAWVLSKMAVKNPIDELPRIFIVTQRSLLSAVSPVSYIRELSIVLRKGQEIDVESLVSRLSALGYLRVPRVGMKGEFAVRGEVLDIFLCGEESAHRITFDFDTICAIKTFDIETQVSKDSQERLVISPMKEVIWNDELVERLEKAFSRENSNGVRNDFAAYDQKRHANEQSFDSDSEKKYVYDDGASSADAVMQDEVHLSFTDEALRQKERILTELSVSGESEGEELFYNLLWDERNSLLDYFPDDTPVFLMDFDRLVNGQKLIENEYSVSYRQARQTLPVLRPKSILMDTVSLAKKCSVLVAFRSLETLSNMEDTDTRCQMDLEFKNTVTIHSEQGQSYFGNINYFKEQLSSMQNENWNVFIFADNPNQSLRIREILKEYCEKNENNMDKKLVEVYPQAITSGFSIADEKILVIQENEIFGRRKNAPKSIRKARSQALTSFVELTPGDYIVHANYGIGLFKGIERIKALGTERDYIKLEYAGEDFVFVPIEQVNLVSRYIGSNDEKPRIDTIGSKSWSQRKEKVQKKVEEIAEKLIDLYSKRKASKGFPFPKDGEWAAAFEAAFPYEDTPDQATATREIKEDMESLVPMDRLVCGDVGYGKTEIAMRAAFKAVMGGKQVAFLAPTTILAEQHFENCIERFKNFPVQMAQLSRFVSPSQQKKILEKVSEGKIDLLVGTHRILQKDVKFKDLGLIIIDEEQRFGVKDKEKLKVMKTNVDCLAMSATPIPRTLHMSLLKIRDMSLLTTAPQNRQPIETVIEEFDEEKVARAIRNEVSRGGQVFYLHNRVETLEETRIKLQNLLPEMMVDVAHGQMTSDELDDIFRRFKMGGFHILVATTIIENGIDIPNVNTIIIDRADMYGVSQLYQLRGRVGRSDRKAYAYLFYPENKVLSEVAMKRLQVISDFTDLGSGFKIAMKDMEIRGAGNLLGKDQSGEVYAVGFEMYLNLLNSAIERLSSSNWQSQNEVLLELEYSGYIPDSYIDDAQIKMEFYKKIASVQDQQQLDAIWEEFNDRFGPVPDEAASLLSLAKIRIICNRLSISSLREKMGQCRIEFSQVAKLNIDKILRLIKNNPKTIRLDPKKPNEIILQTQSIDLKSKSDFIKEKLEQLL